MKTKDKILAASLALFNEQGIRAVTTNHIAEEIGISPGNLYYYFKNKEEILRALFSQMIDALDENFKVEKGQSIDLSHVTTLFRQNFKLILDYPLFAREFFTLLQKDVELKKLFLVMKEKRFTEIQYILESLIQAEVLRLPDDGVTLESLIEMIWLMAFFWTPYLYITDQPLNQATVEKGMETVLNLLRPYLI
jgi:AcrR family transcriptional regulator